MKISTTIFIVILAAMLIYAVVAISAQKTIAENPEILKAFTGGF